MKTDLYRYKTEPYEHQINAVKFVVDHCLKFPDDAYFALFMQQGTGKTKTVIDIAENLCQAGCIDRVLIIAPNGVHEQWGSADEKRGQIKMHGFLDSSVFVWKSNGEKGVKKLDAWVNQTSKLKYLCVNVEAFSLDRYVKNFRDFVAGGKTMVVIDEATSIKNPQAARTINIVNGLSECQYRGKRVVSRKPLSVVRCVLTGTPYARGIYGIWSLFDFLKQGYFGKSYYAFKATYGIERTVQYPGVAIPVRRPLQAGEIEQIRKKVDEQMYQPQEIAIDYNMSLTDVMYILEHRDSLLPYKNLAEVKALVAERAVTIRKEDCLDLPPKIYEKVYVPMSDEQKRITKELQKSAWTMYQNGGLDVKNKTGLIVRLRQVAGGFFPATYELVDDVDEVQYDKADCRPIGTLPKLEAIKRRLEEDDDVTIIVCAFRAEAQAVYDELSKDYDCSLIIGGMSAKARQKEETMFTSGQSHILVAVEQAIAKGFNFQMASVMYFYSCAYSAEDRAQIEDRINRIGQTKSCLYVDFISDGSVDESVLESVNGNLSFQSAVTSDNAKAFFDFIKA